MKKVIIFLCVGIFLIGFISSLYYNSNSSLGQEKQEIQSQILDDYLDGKITKKEAIERLKEVSCLMAMKSGVKYNKEMCEW